MCAGGINQLEWEWEFSTPVLEFGGSASLETENTYWKKKNFIYKAVVNMCSEVVSM